MTMATTARPPIHHLSLSFLLIYPAILLIGSLFSIISPTAQPPKPTAAAAAQNQPPPPANYFARKHNIFNQYFVKIGWAWMTFAFFALVVSQPAYIVVKKISNAQQQQSQRRKRLRRIGQASARYSVATLAWYLTTQWFFGPPIIDRGFTFTGGRCENRSEGNREGLGSQLLVNELFTAATCKAAGGDWNGGYDVSGHVFMLILMTVALGCEVLGVSSWSCASSSRKGKVEGEAEDHESLKKSRLGVWSLRFVLVVIGLSFWMLLMTAIFFHTWVEKVCFSFVCLNRSIFLFYADFSNSGLLS